MVFLSIGMIVKNEAHNLPKTLEALQPLRDAIACQLIIADTGSEDNTIEIAREYADDVFSIPWENDFSKARNATLKRAKGQWFFYLDADEVLTDSEELIAFFKNPANKKYHSINICVRSYTSYASEKWADIWSNRLFQISKDVYFKYAIHEIHPKVMPMFNLTQTKLLHSGYNNDDVELMKFKTQRNSEIMEALLSQSLDENYRAKTLLDYADTLSLDKNRGEESIKAIKEAIDLMIPWSAKREDRLYNLTRAYSLWLRLLHNADQVQECIVIGQQYLTIQPQRGIWDLDINFLLGDAYIQQKQYREAEEFLDRYLAAIDQNLVKVSDYFLLASVAFKEIAQFNCSLCAEKNGNDEKAWQLINQVTKDTLGGQSVWQARWRLVFIGDTANRLNTFYHMLVDEEHRKVFYVDLAKEIAGSSPEKKEKIKQGLRTIGERRALPLMAICSQSVNEMQACLLEMHDDMFSISQGEIIFHCLRLKTPMKWLLPHLDPELLEGYLHTSATYHKDMTRYAMDYYANVDRTHLSLAEHDFAQYLMCYSLFTTDNAEIPIQQAWSLTLQLASSYLMRIYQPAVLEQENAWVLSPLEQFVVLAQEAEENREAKNYHECMVILQRCLTIYPKAKAIAEHILIELELLIDPRKAELNQLAIVVKNQIKEQIRMGNLDTARQLVKELSEIVPDDLEVISLQEQVNEYNTIWN